MPPPPQPLSFYPLFSCALHSWEEECIFQYSWRSKFSWKRGGPERDPASLGTGWGCQKQLQDSAKPPSHSRNQWFPTADLLACLFFFFSTTSYYGCDLCPLLNMTRLPCMLTPPTASVTSPDLCTFSKLLGKWKLCFIMLFELQFSRIEDLVCWCWSENRRVGRAGRTKMRGERWCEEVAVYQLY